MPHTPTNVLTKILQRKTEVIAARKQQRPLASLQADLSNAPTLRGFLKALSSKINQKQPAVIAEIKRASPSKGIIRHDFNPQQIAETYARHGATCLSILTDEDFFQGSDDHLVQARQACSLPALRKDVIIDEYQVYESRLLGADCILLIVAALNDAQLKALAALATELTMDVLVEVHNGDELQRALPLDLPLLGINNRDLSTFKTNLNTTFDLLADIPADKIIITESGINTKADIELMMQHHVYGFLIGEALMRAEDPGAALASLL